jgi:hypothetical protein
MRRSANLWRLFHWTLGERQPAELEQALKKALGSTITESDPSRWKPTVELLEEIEQTPSPVNLR